MPLKRTSKPPPPRHNCVPVPFEEGRYYVESRSTPGETYIVDVLAEEETADFRIIKGTCPCKGWQIRKVCSHLTDAKEEHLRLAQS